MLPLVLSPPHLSPNPTTMSAITCPPSSTHLHLQPPFPTISSPHKSYHLHPRSIMEVSDLISRTEKVTCEEAKIELPLSQAPITSTNLILLAKLITNKDIGLTYDKDVAFKAWNPIYPLEVERINKNIFMFSFHHEVDAHKAYHRRPWS